jgi:hypothetical protein
MDRLVDIGKHGHAEIVGKQTWLFTPQQTGYGCLGHVGQDSKRALKFLSKSVISATTAAALELSLLLIESPPLANLNLQTELCNPHPKLSTSLL